MRGTCAILCEDAFYESSSRNEYIVAVCKFDDFAQPFGRHERERNHQRTSATRCVFPSSRGGEDFLIWRRERFPA
jgi:hypothetical protein